MNDFSAGRHVPAHPELVPAKTIGLNGYVVHEADSVLARAAAFSGAPLEESVVVAWPAGLQATPVLPIAVVAGLLFVDYYEREQRQLTRNAINQARHCGSPGSADRLHAGRVAGAAHRLAAGDLEGFYGRVQEALANIGADSIPVMDMTGRILLSSRLPYGEPLPKIADAKLLNRVVKAGRSGVCELFISRIANRPIYTVAVPVKAKAAGKGRVCLA